MRINQHGIMSTVVDESSHSSETCWQRKSYQ